MFDIRFVNERSAAEEQSAYGEIRIGAFRESFRSDLSFWTRADYEGQWRRAAQQLSSLAKAALITSMGDPASAVFLRWWAMYRSGDVVFFQDQLVFFRELGRPFDPLKTGPLVRERRTIAEGTAISEWTVGVASVLSFIGPQPRM